MERELKPQSYEHRTECVVQGLVRASTAAQKLSLYLREQLGDEWRKQDRLLVEAIEEEEAAIKWIKKSFAE